MRNAMGDELNDAQAELVKAYRTIEDVLRNRAEELAPYEARNATKALAALWQVMNGLDMEPGQLYDLGA
ncbi:MAG: hypothetical protein H0W27_03970 [Actinobacteria bacterium]|nr:hypothetical protein [Actinomycetota bacterium]